MALLPSSACRTLTIPSSSSLFLDSYRSFSSLSPQNSSPPPPAVGFLSSGSPLPPPPQGFPQHKLIPRTRFVVDGFRSAGDFSVSYFLSHFHSDHYGGLGPAWCRGVIYCSELTARLLVEALGVSPLFVVSLSLGECVRIDGCDVTAIEANHCPGAVQFLFDVRGGEKRAKYVHTGDFRYCESMNSDPVLGGFVGADAVFLDTTYCNPKFSFPSQDESIEYIVSTIEKNMIREFSADSVLFLISTYVVGKEKILLEISRRLNCALHVDGMKMGILRVLGFGDPGVFTEDSSSSHVHVIGWNLLGEFWPYFRPNFVKMKEIMLERGYAKAVGFVPSGWVYKKNNVVFPVSVNESLEIHIVPYSEHSSYEELREYVRFLRPKRVIPTVGNDSSKLGTKHALEMHKHFAGLVDEKANKKDFLMGFLCEPKDGNGSDPVINGNSCESCDDIIDMSSPCLQDSNALSNEELESAIQELYECLPSWVTKDQILCLLNNASGDIIEAVSEFYEHETELHRQANALTPTTSSPQICTPNFSTSRPLLNSSQEDPDTSKTNLCGHGDSDTGKTTFFGQKKKSIGKEPVSVKTTSPGKRGITTGNKAKKKGKLCSKSELHGFKQATITKFFGKIVSDSSHEGGPVSTNVVRDSAIRKMLEANSENGLDKFLQIIDGGLTRNTAAALLEKTSGNVSLALDLYYTGSISIAGDSEMSLCSTELNENDAITICHIDNEKNSLKGSSNLPAFFVKETSTEEGIGSSVSLPLEKYSPVQHAFWESGQPAPYIHLARTFDMVEKEKGRIKTTSMLCNMFRSLLALSPEDVLPAVYLCTNKIAPDHENMELNIGGGLVTAALEQACGVKRSKIREMYNDIGDLGDVAQICRQTQSLLSLPRPLFVRDLFSVLRMLR
ncbi:hypothetical protein Taro_002099 [Colocasia esculenta]|uniref:DNA ligase 6 n=1 Tax=Colocasia esculenta TaxID=4460 RepID=A0A843TK12_COLES|nr:hypothetical protein [Colocasia esculenta]